MFFFEYILRINTIFTALKLYFNKNIYLFRDNLQNYTSVRNHNFPAAFFISTEKRTAGV